MSFVMNDKKPDARFAMIALELAEPGCIAPGPPLPDAVRVDPGGNIACPKCGNSAFEQSSDRSTVRCMGCPPPAPTWTFPPGVELSKNRYRCERCSKSVLVTMTLSHVNLYCGGCERLSIHVRQDVNPSPRRPKQFSSALVPDRASTASSLLSLSLTKSVYVDEVNDVSIPDDHPPLVTLVRAMSSILELDDFDLYPALRRNDNQRAALTDPGITDVRRGTGRTTRGIVELMARHYLATTRPAVWVLGGSERIDDWLRAQVLAVRDRLGNEHPTKVGVVPDMAKLVNNELRPPSGVMLFVDHTFYERGEARPSGPLGIMYKP